MRETEFLPRAGMAAAKGDVSNPVSNYWGFNPRASNCRLHSAGAFAQPFDSDAARQPTFDPSPDEIRC